MEGINDYLKKRASQLGLERADQLGLIQQQLDKLFPGQCRAISINSGVLHVTTPSSSVAGELRYHIRELTSETVKKVIISIR